ncbi:LysR family transcriptional regulator [Paludibacterium purpuratum]|uniref:LysR family transcriptional regulator n=1 Tax=Paludibacterium purpuratum TaxID=1144873 RepID=A0A4R7B393_9NEIS|nr:LysR family transcriptional regulator [Paludibacterium purpuratum]TDR76490.1 LysR family transcriptional regulator [Paludibacterium purpuratum]
MDLFSAMRIYTRVVECGGLSAAARDLGIGQPAVSERIRQLERHVGARLLDRTTRSVQPTDAGVRFYQQAKAALEAAEAALAGVAAQDAGLSGTLRIAAPHGLGELLLPPLLVALQQQHPALTVNLVLNDRFVDPVAEGVDLSLRVGALGNGGFIACPLGTVRRAILAAPRYLARHGTPTTPGELVAHPFIRIAGLTSNETLPLLDRHGAPCEAPIRTAWRCNHWRPLLEALLAGAGIGVLQLPACQTALADGQLREILPDYRLAPLPVHAIYPAGRHTPAKTRALLALLQERWPQTPQPA